MRRFAARFSVSDGALVVGFGLVASGVALVSLPAGLIVAGVLLCVLSVAREAA
ncbi:hypothetical protein [Parafrankia sp. EUN1f]|uniref:hypothetical protein n=1 Tax=Parafrankia sp. EUN1f TaxID=102897 RepID=UPI0001C45572|nr:hypothetical protein [Parafrankia sp. EUN1f]EFC86457.1 hypothetical protein FrEUN1fDRAFT_0352 [Parafrankia sp. EUN1f]